MNLLIHDIAAAIERDATEDEPPVTRIDHTISATAVTWADEWRERSVRVPPRRSRRSS
jgi:hypothetical protein